MKDADSGLGTRKIGWLCGYVPEELILAAGFEPVRILGRVEQVKQADSYAFPNFCPYLKNVLDSGLRGEYQDIDGIVFTNSCDCMRRIYDLWRHYMTIPFAHMLDVPKNRGESAIRFFSDQLLQLNSRLGEFSGVTVSDGKLREAISLMNEQRRTMMEIFEAQKEIAPRYKGSELLGLSLDAMTLSKERTTATLRDLAAQSTPGSSFSDQLPRVLVIGNVVDRKDLLEIVEAAGASVVAFDICAGLRHWSDLVEEEEEDPIQSLARRYLLKPPCPRMPGFKRRIEQISQLVRDYSIDGVIYSLVKFCDYGLFEAPVIETALQDFRIPFMVIENDYVFGDTGRIGIRLEAFVEMMKGDLD